MNSQEVHNDIILSDHLDIEKVNELKTEYYEPFISFVPLLLEYNSGVIKPRRILGNYMTYLVKDADNIDSVMLKKSSSKYGVQCDCDEYHKNEKCKHIAAVLWSTEKQINNELLIKKKFDEELELHRLKKEQASQVKQAQIDKLKDQNSKIITADKLSNKTQKNIEEGDPLLRAKPYVIKDARNFGYYKLVEIIPGLYKVNRKNKTFSKELNKGVKGVDVLYKYHTLKHKISFRVNDNDDIEVQCTCGSCYEGNLCGHATDAIYYLSYTGNQTQFIAFTNQEKEKNALLSEYGLTVDDNEVSEFKFSTDYSGRLQIIYVPPYFINLSKIKKIKEIITTGAKPKPSFRTKDQSCDVGLLFQLSHHPGTNAPLRIEATKIEKSKKGDDKLSRIIIGKEENIHLLRILEPEKFNILMDFSYVTFKEMIGSGYYTQSYYNFVNHHYDATRKQYLKYFYSRLEEHWQELSTWDNIKLLMDDDSFAKSNLKSLSLSPSFISSSLSIVSDDRFIKLHAVFSDGDGNPLDTETFPVHIYGGRIVLLDNTLYWNKNSDMYSLLETMPKGKLIFPSKYSEAIIKDVLYPISQKFGLELPDNLMIKVKNLPMIPSVHLMEYQDSFLKIVPNYNYGDYVIEMNDSQDHFIREGEENYFLIRNVEEEEAFTYYIRTMHPQFKNQNSQPYFILPFEDVMKNQWFIHFSKEMMAQDIKMIGFNELKRFKYNSSTPKWDMKVSSGIDWFDIKINAQWGDQVMSFRDIRKAIMNGQNFVVLGDGSFGMLPEEWIKKYSNLFKFGVDDKETLKVSKKHFNIIELLFDQINDEDILAEIEEKKQKLLRIENVQTQPVPDTITATLRPYQETGYQWMQVLDEISWGGCLADDMGLGKTLQAITFLAFLKKKYRNPTSLIICPTSLIYNWENELKKFAPELRYHLFYGLGREFTDDHFNDYDIIISSYGIVRNDIESLVKFDWEYIILDESQAIKNPDAISTKAVQLLKSRNKFILSGTPLQNNTFDIYAQFNFLNPGMLGGKEFFRHEFANPIDKSSDKEAGIMLRKLIKPFMLRRTKSEVAPDLPEKTEVILWCQMEKAQKILYDEYKDYYRHALMQKIETEGMAKAGVYILEGLLRLRQICDDPRLIKDKEAKAGKGIKILELTREITENMGDHKMLIFSQFTEMLALIRTEMEENKIKYCYLDGSTPASMRQEQVDAFQNNKEIGVFLISLKAGGVGLNLTEADYVYIVDPWWNPAVEQQAIDRTHRIGQKNKIFAYKMICKDSVEEKIIQLQEKKMSVSKEIVQEDSAFFKSLTKDDIGFLFS